MKQNTSGKRGGKPDTSVQSADPTVLTYLYAASKAFPAVEAILDKQSEDMTLETLNAMRRSDELDAQLDTQVRRYKVERQKTTVDEEALIEKALLAEKQIAAEDDRFETDMREMTRIHQEKCAEIQAEIDRLNVKLKQAKAWEAVRAQRKLELATQEAKVAALKLQHKGEIKSLMAQHEEDRRKLRDVLVKKLRTMRDHMTNDDYVATTLPDAQHGIEGNGLSGIDVDSPFSLSSSNQHGASSAVKLTERLSREVTTYERETKATTSAINVHQAQLESVMSQLNAARETNERLVFRNAANAQSHKLLQQKLDEAKRVKKTEPTSGVSTPRSPRSPRHAMAKGTLSTHSSHKGGSSGQMIDKTHVNLDAALAAERQLRTDLENDLRLAQEEVAAAAKERKIAEHQLLAQVEKDLNALEFIESLEELISKNKETKQGSGRIGDVLPPLPSKPSAEPSRTHDGIANKNTNEENSSKVTPRNRDEEWVPEPVYAVGLHSEEDILRFLSVAMNSLLASVPKDFVTTTTLASK